MKEIQNFEKIPEESIEICKMLHDDENAITIAVPTSLSSYIRQIDSSFYMPYSRYPDDLGKELSKTQVNPSYAMSEAGKRG